MLLARFGSVSLLTLGPVESGVSVENHAVHRISVVGELSESGTDSYRSFQEVMLRFGHLLPFRPDTTHGLPGCIAIGLRQDDRELAHDAAL